jgi:hypothetical protein
MEFNNVIFVRVRVTNFWGKAIIITYSECAFVALVMRNALRVRRVLLSFVVYLAVQYFLHIISARA